MKFDLYRSQQWLHERVQTWGPEPSRSLGEWLLILLVPAQSRTFFRRLWRIGLPSLFPQINRKKIHPADPLRILLQLLWVLLLQFLVTHPPASLKAFLKQALHQFGQGLQRWFVLLMPALAQRHKASDHVGVAHRWRQRFAEFLESDNVFQRLWNHRLVRITGYLVAAWMSFLCVSTPFDTLSQLIFVMVLLLIALLIRPIPGAPVTLLLTVLSAVASTRYMWWRISSTLNWDESVDLIWGMLLLAAEIYTYAFLILSYVQTSWPLKRPATPMQAELSEWPSVDVFIPTYNEPLSVVQSTVYAAKGMDWPQDRLNIYLLDDGRRDAFREFAEAAGVNYLIRPDNRHAKAGNINHALPLTHGEYIAIFDCDHMPTRSFLQVNMGWFMRDPKLGLVQTPHHFYSADPFERNLGIFGKIPNEGALFYGLIQDGNDLWGSAFFCGSCAILRREALEAVGGVAVETVTEDAHTSLKIHRLGYTSAYINIPQAAGLATESLSAHIGQRIRWARGMAQIFRLDNPFLGKGLSWAQRICYGNAMLSFFSGIPRIMFLSSPLAFLLFHAYVIYAPAISVVLYVIPHMIHATLINSRTQSRYRHSFWAEVYETVLSWYIARPTAVALINPGKGKFNVTAKGGLVEQEYFDWTISTPFIVLILLNLTGLLAAGLRFAWGPPDEIPTVIINLFWTLYNCLILGGSLAIASETRQLRRSHRVLLSLPAILQLADGKLLHCVTEDVSEGGVALQLSAPVTLESDQTLRISLWRGDEEFSFSAVVVSSRNKVVRVRWKFNTPDEAAQLVQCTFGRADAWVSWEKNMQQDKPLSSLGEVLRMGGAGYGRVFSRLVPEEGRARQIWRQARSKADWWLPRTPRPLKLVSP